MNAYTIDLLNEFKPIFYCDKNEPIKVCNAESYFKNGIVEHDNTINGHVKEINEKIYLYYYLSYNMDAGMEICLKIVDSHKNDIECVIIELNIEKEIMGICYLPHSSSEHFWIRNKEDLNKLFNKKKTKVYISKGKHAMYPIPTVYRYLMFGTDYCKNPQECNYIIIPLSSYLLETTHFNDGYQGFPQRLNNDLTLKKEIRLKDISTRLIFKKFW